MCSLLKKAFEENLLFTIKKDKIVCNDIELITDRFKGPAKYVLLRMGLFFFFLLILVRDCDLQT